MANFTWDTTTKKMKVTLAQQVADPSLAVTTQHLISSDLASVSSWDLENTLKTVQTKYTLNYEITVATIEPGNSLTVPEIIPVIEQSLIETSRTNHLSYVDKTIVFDYKSNSAAIIVVPEVSLVSTLFDNRILNVDDSFKIGSISRGIPLSLNQIRIYNDKFLKYKKSILTIPAGKFDSVDVIKFTRQIKELDPFKTQTVVINRVDGIQIQTQLIPTTVANGKITVNPQKDVRAQKSINMPTKTLIGGDICYYSYKSIKSSRTLILDHKLEVPNYTVDAFKIQLKKFPNNISPTNVNGKGLPIIFDFSAPVMEQEWRTV
jgi:hypothetical protein